MERWAANTLRTLGIILTSGFVLVSSALLLLLSMCAAQGDFGGSKHPEQVVPYLAAAVAVLVAGISFIVWLARGIFQSASVPEMSRPGAGAIPPQSTDAKPPLPLHLSPLGRKAIDRLVLALGAQIVISAAAWFFNQLHFWTAPHAFAPHNWTLTLLATYILHQIPYAILIYLLLKRPSCVAFTCAIAIPSVLLLQSLFGLSMISAYYVHHPVGFLLFFIPWSLHIVILVLAYKAIQQVGTHPLPSSIIVAAIAAFVYFSLIQSVTVVLYRLNLRWHP